MPIKGTKQTVIVYSGALYEDAESACKQGGTTVTNKSEGSANARAVAKKNERHDAYILLARSKGYDENAELYAAPVGMYKSFCNLFWLNPKNYTVENPPRPSAPTTGSAITDATSSADELAKKCTGILYDQVVRTRETLRAFNLDFMGVFGTYAKNFVRFSEEARAGFKTLEVIAESSIEAVELLKKIHAVLDRLDTRQEEMNERLSGLAQIETGISANVAKTVTFVDRFTKR